MKGPFLSFFRDCFFVPPFTPTAPLVCSSHYSLECLHWLSWDCRNGHHNRNRLGPQPAMANSHIKSEAFVGKHLLRHNMLLLFLFFVFLWTCITHTDCTRSGIPTVNNAVSDFNFKSLVDFFFHLFQCTGQTFTNITWLVIYQKTVQHSDLHCLSLRVVMVTLFFNYCLFMSRRKSCFPILM